MFGQNKIKYVQLAIIIVLLLSFLFPTFNLYLKSLMNIFAFGISDFKVYYILLFLLIGTIIYQLPQKDNSYFYQIWLSIAFLFLIGLTFHLFIFTSTNLNPYDRTVFAYEDEFSSTHIFHIHETKVIMGQITQFFPSIMNSYDSGIPFLNYIHPLFIILFTLGYIISLFYFLQSTRSVKEHLFLYLISGSVVYKNIIDGGIFNPENVIAFSIFSYLIFKQYKKDILNYILVCIGIYALWYGLFGSLNFLVVLSMASLGYGVLYLVEQKKYIIALLLFLLVLIFLFTTETSFSPYYLEKIHEKIPEDSYIKIVSKQDITQNNTMMIHNKTKIGSYYWYTIQNKQPTTKAKLAKYFDLNLHYNPLSVHQNSCNIHQPYNFTTQVYNAKIDNLTYPIVNIYAVNKNTFTFELAGCTPSPERTIMSFLFENGNKYAVLIPETS